MSKEKRKVVYETEASWWQVLIILISVGLILGSSIRIGFELMGYLFF